MAFPDEVARNVGSVLTDPLQELVVIGPYEPLPATCNDHDPRSFEVAKLNSSLQQGKCIKRRACTLMPPP